jgi:hypothetical protein
VGLARILGDESLDTTKFYTGSIAEELDRCIEEISIRFPDYSPGIRNIFSTPLIASC